MNLSLRSSRGGKQSEFQNSNLATGNRKWRRKDVVSWTREEKDLTNLIWALIRWVDKRILEQLNIRDKSAIRMALEQIHWRGIEESRNGNPGYIDSQRTYNEVLKSFGIPVEDWKSSSRQMDKGNP